ncbi:IceA2 protein [Helicobacter pylori]|uniref:IceA2 protein n=1 Tax=Helicobacter pylori TaxID=210 RepID=UPI00073DA40F|nr:IceA2 protein [Helicobacter pylori]OKA00494.1 IceA2 protein [Helicobacter pylori]OKA02341.1 IceA2 protein [Helicobacter pylori]OMQ17197.1 IceA2 protein [Helicobacter pylori]OMQ17402.1 IceA2 protein [Helicobacter pylori]
MAVVVKVVNGKIQEFENGFRKRTYGSNAVNVQVSGRIVAVTTSKGKVEEYKNGSYKRTY